MKAQTFIGGMKGQNSFDDKHYLADDEFVLALNVDPKRGAIRSRSGRELVNYDDSKTGGISFMKPFYKPDGTKQLIFANGERFYRIDDTTDIDGAWGSVSSMGNTSGDQEPNGIVFGGYMVLGSRATGLYFGDATTQFNITTSDGLNYVYTYSGVGTAPLFVTNGLTDSMNIYISATGFSANNRGTFSVVIGSVTETAFTVTNIDGGTAENGKALGHAKALNTVENLILWNGTISSRVFYAPTDKVNLFEIFNGIGGFQLASAERGTNTLWLSCYDNPLDWQDTADGADSLSIAVDDGETIQGLKAQGNTLWVYKQTKKYAVRSEYDEVLSAYVATVKQDFSQSGGTSAYDSLKTVITAQGDDVYSLATKDLGVTSFGRVANFGDSPIDRTISQSINDYVRGINWDKAYKSRAEYYKGKYYLACPYGSNDKNDLLFVKHLDTGGGWSLYNHWQVGAMCKYRDTDGLDNLYLADNLAPKIYKLNSNSYSDDLSGYTRKIVTGKKDLDTKILYKKFYFIEIWGYISNNTELYVTVNIDDISKNTFKIDSSFIRGTSPNSFIGDVILGDEFIGGDTADSEYFFIGRIMLPDSMRIGRFIQLAIDNSGKGESWQINGWTVFYDLLPDTFFSDDNVVKVIS